MASFAASEVGIHIPGNRGTSYAAPPNKPMQRAGTHKVLGRGRVSAVREQVCRARVLNRQRAVADGCRYAPFRARLDCGTMPMNWR